MLPPRRLSRFFLTVGLVYVVLMAPWPGLKQGYASLFRNAGNIIFARFWFWQDGGVRFLDLTSMEPGDLAPGTPKMAAVGTFDTVMELRSRRAPGSIGYLRISSRYVGFGPTIVVIALVVATPLSLSRRIRALFWGLVLIHFFIVSRVTLTLTAGGFAAEKKYALFHPSPGWRTVLTEVESVFSDDPTVSFVVPAAVWFLVALRHCVRTAQDDKSLSQ